MSTFHHHRRTPSAVKTNKGQRPGLPRALSSPKIASSLGKKRISQIETESESHDSEDDMTFLQYCPTCDKQIVVPNTSILYCSESCRRKDASTPPSTATTPPLSPLMSPTNTPSTPSTPRTIVPPLTPSTLATFASKPPLQHSAKADLDPTEWKPDLRAQPPSRPPNPRTLSAAQTYLAQFHRDAPYTTTTTTTNPYANPYAYARRGVPLASTAPGLVGCGRKGSGSSGSSGSSTESGEEGSSRESSVVGTPGDAGSVGRPLVWSASTATMALDAKSVGVGAGVGEGEGWGKGLRGEGVEGGLRRMLGGM